MDEGREDDLSPCEVNHEEGTLQSNNNSYNHISDVLEAIQSTDPEFSNMCTRGNQLISNLPSVPQPQTIMPYVKITEQPASKSLRFRYECEGRSAGSIPGANSTTDNKTYPTIEIVGYTGRAMVVVSCVTKDMPYRPHPHNLVGKDCRKGVCTVEINSEDMRFSFSNLGIQCVKKKDIEEALRVREEIRVNPFQRFAHRSQPSSIDLNAVRLCFQAFLEGPESGQFLKPLKPVVSDTIFDKKAMSDLVICKLSHCSALVTGGQEVILLCEKVSKDDISIKFYEEINGVIVWDALADFQHANVHKQVAISFRTPRYKNIEIDQPVQVYIQLRRPSNGTTSESLPFELLPLDSAPEDLKRKRQKFNGDPSYYLVQHLRPQMPDNFLTVDHHHPSTSAFTPNIFMPEPVIKTEPSEQLSPFNANNFLQPTDTYRGMPNTPSPQPHASPPQSTDYNAWGGGASPFIQHTQHLAVDQPTSEVISNFSDLIDMENLLENVSNAPVQYENANEPDNQRMNTENMTDSFNRLLNDLRN